MDMFGLTGSQGLVRTKINCLFSAKPAGYDQLAKDFTKHFLNTDEPTPLFDVVFQVGQGKQKNKLFGVRAILGGLQFI